MTSTAVINTSTDINSVLQGFKCENIQPEFLISFKFPDDTRIISPSPCSKFIWINQTAFESNIISEQNTKGLLVPKSKHTATLHNPDQPESHSNTKTSIEEESNLKSIASIFLSKIDKMEKGGKLQESIKEVHRLFESLLSMSSFDVANQILLQSTKMSFSVTILVAFLASTLPFKTELPNRSSVFNLAEKAAFEKFGEENIRKSVFTNLE